MRRRSPAGGSWCGCVVAMASRGHPVTARLFRGCLPVVPGATVSPVVVDKQLGDVPGTARILLLRSFASGRWHPSEDCARMSRRPGCRAFSSLYIVGPRPPLPPVLSASWSWSWSCCWSCCWSQGRLLLRSPPGCALWALASWEVRAAWHAGHAHEPQHPTHPRACQCLPPTRPETTHSFCSI